MFTGQKANIAAMTAVTADTSEMEVAISGLIFFTGAGSLAVLSVVATGSFSFAPLAGWEHLEARFERAITLLLIPGRQAEGDAELDALGCPPPAN
jgi:hypothetical protein